MIKTKSDLSEILKNLSPDLNVGDYVFCTLEKNIDIQEVEIVFTFLEKEGKTIVLRKEIADKLNLKYQNIMSWITLNVFSSLEAVGLTAAVSNVLTKNNISCNVVAAYYHDHVFVSKNDAKKAIDILNNF